MKKIDLLEKIYALEKRILALESRPYWTTYTFAPNSFSPFIVKSPVVTATVTTSGSLPIIN